MKGGYLKFDYATDEWINDYPHEKKKYKYSEHERLAVIKLIPKTGVNLKTFWKSFNVDEYDFSIDEWKYIKYQLQEACRLRKEAAHIYKVDPDKYANTDYSENTDLSVKDKSHLDYYFLLVYARNQVHNKIEDLKDEQKRKIQEEEEKKRQEQKKERKKKDKKERQQREREERLEILEREREEREKREQKEKEQKAREERIQQEQKAREERTKRSTQLKKEKEERIREQREREKINTQARKEREEKEREQRELKQLRIEEREQRDREQRVTTQLRKEQREREQRREKEELKQLRIEEREQRATQLRIERERQSERLADSNPVRRSVYENPLIYEPVSQSPRRSKRLAEILNDQSHFQSRRTVTPLVDANGEPYVRRKTISNSQRAKTKSPQKKTRKRTHSY